METRLRSKRKQSEEEAAALQSQILTRNTVKKARASGIAAPLIQEHREVGTPVVNEGSRHQSPVDTPEGNEVPQARNRATPRARPPTRQQAGTKHTSGKGKQARSIAAEDAGPSNAEQRHADLALKEEATQAQDEMERQRREDSDDAHGREGADDEVCQGSQATFLVGVHEGCDK